MRLFLVFLFFLSSPLPNHAQNSRSLFDSLYNEKDIIITLYYPFDSIYASQRNTIDAKVSIETSSGFIMKDAALELDIRGKFRRMKCTMPPLLLNFKKSTLRDLGLNAMDKIKLVTHCLDGPEGQENLEEERLCYQLYESLTPISYRTIWLTVQYVDSDHPDSSYTSAGFLIEPDDVLSARLGVIEKKIYSLSEDSLHFESFAKVTAFNFLIGNRDWSIVASRNVKLFLDPATQVYVVVPYDFDFANIVGATYRREILPRAMKHPFDRIFEGEYFATEVVTILQNLYQLKSLLVNTIQVANNPIDRSRRKKITRYFDSWFSFIEKCPVNEMQYGLICPYKGSL